MIGSLIQLAFARSTPALTQLGLKRDAVGLWSRATRHRAIWAAHEARCHAVVARAVEGSQTRDTVVVLGSGLCRDVPIAQLAEAFRRVILVDAVHLPFTRLRLRALRAVSFDTRDLTGCADWIVGRTGERRAPLTDLQSNHSISLVISANCLSQLPIAVENWLERHPSRAAQLPTDLGDRAIGWHLDDLAAFRCPVCLLTDVEMTVSDKAGKVLETLDLIAPHTLPPPDETWEWEVAPFGELSRNSRRVHRVNAYTNLAASDARA